MAVGPVRGARILDIVIVRTPVCLLFTGRPAIVRGLVNANRCVADAGVVLLRFGYRSSVGQRAQPGREKSAQLKTGAFGLLICTTSDTAELRYAAAI